MTRPDQSEGDRPRDELLAGEYVLGVLSEEARARVEARLRTDKAFAAIVARWQENLLRAEDEDVAMVEPHVMPLRSPGNDRHLALPRMSRARREGSPVASLANSLVLWRALAFCFLFLLIGTVLFAERPGSSSGPGHPVLAELHLQDVGSLGLMARYDQASGVLRLIPAAATAEEPHALQVWLTRGTDPAVSLGLLPPSGEGELLVPAALRNSLTRGGASLSVSLEPPTGSGGAKPSGPVVAVGETRSP